MKYESVPDGWFAPDRKGYNMKCCGCGLTHSIKFELRDIPQGKEIRIKVDRDERATSLARRVMDFVKINGVKRWITNGDEI